MFKTNQQGHKGQLHTANQPLTNRQSNSKESTKIPHPSISIQVIPTNETTVNLGLVNFSTKLLHNQKKFLHLIYNTIHACADVHVDSELCACIAIIIICMCMYLTIYIYIYILINTCTYMGKVMSTCITVFV